MKKIINEEILKQECKFLKSKNSKIFACITLLAIASYWSIRLDHIEVIAITIPFILICLVEYLCTKLRLSNIELVLVSGLDNEDESNSNPQKKNVQEYDVSDSLKAELEKLGWKNIGFDDEGNLIGNHNIHGNGIHILDFINSQKTII